MIPWSRSDFDSTATIESQFCDFNILDALGSLPLHVAIRETPIWSLINGPDLISIQQLRLNRDFTYHDIGILDVNKL
jgi:hypothetical protein